MTIRTHIGPVVACLAVAGLMSASALAQQPAGPNPCASDPHFRDFDFWLGEWQVTNRANGSLAGTNTIISIEAACALEERWSGRGGSTGMSVNYYNPVSGQWRQVWVTGGAYAIDIVGGLDAEGSMVLEGTIYYYRSGKRNPFRGTWTPNADGSVRQYFQQADPETGEWTDWFDGLYTKMNEIKD